MRIIRDVTADEVIVEFLKAEIVSPSCGHWYRTSMKRLGVDFEMIERADLNNPEHNAIRTRLLTEIRGTLLKDLPEIVKWKLTELECEDLKTMKYINHSTWNTLTKQSRLVADGARNVDSIQTFDDANRHIKEIAKSLIKGAHFPAIIIVGDKDQGFVIIEGSKRATAHILAKTKNILAFVGRSSRLSSWKFF